MARSIASRTSPAWSTGTAAAPRLRELANLLVVGGYIDPTESSDHEEREQISRYACAHRPARVSKGTCAGWDSSPIETSSANSIGSSPTRGAFVQPALFEAYGLTVIEAMTSGLPTFATCYGGPSEIIQDEVSGFHIDPNQGDEAAEKMADFFAKLCEAPRVLGSEIPRAALRRVAARYTWKLYAERMMTLARIYGFWKYVTNLERQETRKYLGMFHALQYRPLAEAIPH
jgi:sucrose synthase